MFVEKRVIVTESCWGEWGKYWGRDSRSWIWVE